MASTTPNQLGKSIQFLESIDMYDDSVELLMLAAGQHSMTVRFKNLVEDASQKTFICKVEIGGLLDECIGYGQSKREAKVNAADDAIAKLTENLKVPKPMAGTPQEQPSSSRISESEVTSSMNGFPKYRSSSFPRSLSLPESTVSMTNNPIGELQELATARGWPKPEYQEIDEQGEPHRKTFIIECKVKYTTSEGQGSTKKAAKKQAAEKMLEMVQPSGSSGPSLLRNLSAPGVEQRDSPHSSAAAAAITRAHGRESPSSSILLAKMNISSPDTDKRPKNFHCNKLDKLAKKKNWVVEWYDLQDKSYSGNYQCFVKISTDPITICCGSGPTVLSAHDDAAMKALNCLKK